MKTLAFSLFSIVFMFASISSAAAQTPDPALPPLQSRVVDLCPQNGETEQQITLTAELSPSMADQTTQDGNSNDQPGTPNYVFYYLDDVTLRISATTEDTTSSVKYNCGSYRVEFLSDPPQEGETNESGTRGDTSPIEAGASQSFVVSTPGGQGRTITLEQPLIFRTTSLATGTYAGVRITFFPDNPTPTLTPEITAEATDVATVTTSPTLTTEIIVTVTPTAEVTEAVIATASQTHTAEVIATVTPTADATASATLAGQTIVVIPTITRIPTATATSTEIPSSMVVSPSRTFTFSMRAVTKPEVDQLVVLSNLTPQLQELIAAVALFAGVMLVMSIATEIVVDTLRLFLGMKRKLAPMEAIKQLQETLPGRLTGLGVQGEGLQEISRLISVAGTIAEKSDKLDVLIALAKNQPQAMLGELKKLKDKVEPEALEQGLDAILQNNLTAYVTSLNNLTFFKSSPVVADDLRKNYKEQFQKMVITPWGDPTSNKLTLITNYARWIQTDLLELLGRTFYAWAQFQTSNVVNSRLDTLKAQMEELGLQPEQAKQTAESVAMLTQGASLFAVQKVLEGVNDRRTEIENSFWRLFTYPFELLRYLLNMWNNQPQKSTPETPDSKSATEPLSLDKLAELLQSIWKKIRWHKLAELLVRIVATVFLLVPVMTLIIFVLVPDDQIAATVASIISNPRIELAVLLFVILAVICWGLFAFSDRECKKKDKFYPGIVRTVSWLFFNIFFGVALRLLIPSNPTSTFFLFLDIPWVLLPVIYLVVFLGWLKSQDTTALLETLKQNGSFAFLSQTLIKLEDAYRDDENSRIRSVRLLSVVVGIALAVIARVDAAELFTTTVPAFAAALKSLPVIPILPGASLTAGMLLTGLAASAGSTFWHDVLDRLRATKDTAEQIARLTRKAQEAAASQRTP